MEPPLVPIMHWKSRVLSFKELKAGDAVGYGGTYTAKGDERLAILPVGYADGYPRLLSNKGEVALGKRRLSVRGRVSMDLIAVDCTGIKDIREGSSVTLIGNTGKNGVSAWEVANWAETIPYEVFCRISSRVPRIYFDSEAT